MWLINTSTLRRRSFTPPNAPPYAILSHTWEDEEVTFADFNNIHYAKQKNGFTKIREACELARSSGIEYCWIDTCCIDQSSSAELSESINSMFNWYRKAVICYAYIGDWEPHVEWSGLQPLVNKSPPPGDSAVKPAQAPESTISGKTKWFTRGWTLQELIAPKHMGFYDRDWNLRGIKSENSIIEQLERITGIPSFILQDGSEGRLRQISLGQRMSWASARETSRPEDIAYCLMGIFQVNMPLLYGEGERAFFRLQEEIIKYSTDLSIFGWAQSTNDNRSFRGILSCHPREYAHLVEAKLAVSPLFVKEEFTMTNKGFRINTNFFYSQVDGQDVWHRNWDCHIIPLGYIAQGSTWGIPLQRMRDSYVRIFPHHGPVSLSDCIESDDGRTIYIARNLDEFENVDYEASVENGLKIHILDDDEYALDDGQAWPSNAYDHFETTILTSEIDLPIFTMQFNLLRLDKSNGKRYNIDHFNVIWTDLKSDDMAVYLFTKESMPEFISEIKRLNKRDVIKAASDLDDYCNLLSRTGISQITVQDKAARSSILITACVQKQESSIRGHEPKDISKISLKASSALPDMNELNLSQSVPIRSPLNHNNGFFFRSR